MHTDRCLLNARNSLSVGDAVWYQTQGEVLVLAGTALGVKSTTLDQYATAHQVGAGQEQASLIFVGRSQVAWVTRLQLVSLVIHCFGATADYGDVITGYGREE